MVFIIFFLLFIEQAYSFDLKDQNFKFLPEQEKYIFISSTNEENLLIQIFKIKNIEVIKDFNLSTGETYLPLFDNIFQSKYKCERLFVFSKKITYNNSIFLPVKEEGLFAVNLKGKRTDKTIVFLVTELGVFLKKDKSSSVIFAFNRKTGKSKEGVLLKFNLPNKKFKIPVTDKDGFSFIPQETLLYADNILAVFSNSIDLVKIPSEKISSNISFVLLSVPDSVLFFRTEDYGITTFLFKQNQFGEYETVNNFKYKIIWDGITNNCTASNGYGRFFLPIRKTLSAGFYKLLTYTYIEDQKIFNSLDIPVVSEDERNIFLDIRFPSILLKGKKLKGYISLKNWGFRSLKIKKIDWFAENNNRIFSGNKKSLFSCSKIKLSIPTLSLKEGELTLRFKLHLKDGSRIAFAKKIFIYNKTDTAKILLDRKIFMPEEPVNIRVILKTLKGSFTVMKGFLDIYESSSGKQIKRIYLERKPGYTNIIFYPLKGGMYEVRCYLSKNKIADDVSSFWVVPARGDLFWQNDKENFKIITDKDYYNYGDIARVLILSTKKGIDALLTFEGKKIYDAKKIKFDNNFVFLNIPILELFIPNGFLVLNLCVSNNFYQKSFFVKIPPQHKNIWYEFKQNPIRSAREILFYTENIWNRSIKVFSFVKIMTESFFPLFRFYDFYPEIENRVVSSGSLPVEKEKIYNYDKINKNIFIPDEQDFFIEDKKSYSCFFEDKSSTNRLLIQDERFSYDKILTFLVQSISKDAKTGYFSTKFELNNLVGFRLLVPSKFYIDDFPSMLISMNNFTKVKKEVKSVITFFGEDFLVIRTNQTILQPLEKKAYCFNIPEECLKEGIIRILFEGITSETIIKKQYLIEIVKPSYRYDDNIKIKKKIFHSGFSLKNSFYCEDIGVVSLKVPKRYNTEGMFIRDEVPSGFKPLLYSVKKEGGITDGKFVWFPANVKQVRYLIRAVTPGNFVIPPAILTSIQDSESIRLSRKKKMIKIFP